MKKLIKLLPLMVLFALVSCSVLAQVPDTVTAGEYVDQILEADMQTTSTWEWITQNWKVILAVVGLILTIVLRIAPTGANVDWISWVVRILNLIIPNVNKKGRKHATDLADHVIEKLHTGENIVTRKEKRQARRDEKAKKNNK